MCIRDRLSREATESNPESQAFAKARRSLQLNPVSADLETVRIFLERQMEIDNDIIQDLNIVEIKKIHQIKSRRQRKKGGITQVTFSSIHERGLVISHAFNLPKECSVELVCPDHLLPLKRQLDNFAYKVRKYAREVSESKVSTSLRYDDMSETILMAARREGEDDWQHYSLEELKTLDADLQPIEEEQASSDEDTSDLSSGEESDSTVVEKSPTLPSTPARSQLPRDKPPRRVPKAKKK